jgi:hypothetical protein
MPYFAGNVQLIGKSADKISLTNSSITATSLDMNQSNITSLRDPIQGQDAATKAYVDTKLEKINKPYEEVSVTLGDATYVNVIGLKPGSYIVSIMSLSDGFPTATFAIGKSSSHMALGSIFRLTSTPGVGTGEQLELDWPALGMLRLRKTGESHNGDYIVNLNVKSSVVTPENQSLPPVTTVPAGSAHTGLWSMSFTVMTQFNSPLDTTPMVYGKLKASDTSDTTNASASAGASEGTHVRTKGAFQYNFKLKGSTDTRVTTILPGYYFGFVTYDIDPDVYHSTFTIVKKVGMEGGLYPTTAHQKINLIFNVKSNGDFFVRKDSTLYDGLYVFKLS